MEHHYQALSFYMAIGSSLLKLTKIPVLPFPLNTQNRYGTGLREQIFCNQ